MSHAKSPSRRSGFTLVEMLIIAPIALLVITGFIALMVTMVGDAIVSRSQNVMTYDVQSALSAIERDVRLSTEFLVTTSTLPTPQGKDGGTSAFTSTSGDLILGEIATDKNPIDPTRSFIHYNTPNTCGSDNEYQNRIFFTTVIYTVRDDDSLWRRTYVPTPSGTLCDTVWQINTCAPGYSSSATRCDSNDSEILKNVKNFDIEYFINPEDTVSIPAAAATDASSIRVTLETEQSSAGRTVGASSAGRSTKLSSREINLAPPDAPIVTGSNSGTDAVFSWQSVPTASSYIIKYNINGGGWKTATENSTETTFSIPANHGDTVSAQVMSRNTTGASAVASASATIPQWIDCPLENGWVNYNAGAPSHETCGFTVTKHGVVVLKGLIKNGPAGSSRLFSLPDNYRSNQRLIFNAAGSSGTVRINIDANGDVLLGRETGDTTSSGYISLDGILFIPGKSSYTRTLITPQNGWAHYDTGWHAQLQSIADASGRIHVQGLMTLGTVTDGTVIGSIPGGVGTSHRLLTVRSNGGSRTNGVAHAAIYNNGNLVARGSPAGTYFSVQTMYHPSTYSGWVNFSPAVAGTPADGQLGNGWVNYSNTWGPPSYTKAEDGIVSLRGLIGSGNTASGTIVARLPSGYRPKGYLLYQTAMNGDTWSRIDVDSSGYVRVYRSNSGWTSLDGISFVADGS